MNLGGGKKTPPFAQLYYPENDIGLLPLKQPNSIRNETAVFPASSVNSGGPMRHFGEVRQKVPEAPFDWFRHKALLLRP